jgi:hypothetical protein
MIAIGVLLSFSSRAAAKDGDKRVKFYNFDEMLIDGEIKKPSGLLTDVRRQAEFKRLNDMRRSFLKELENTAREKVMR